MPVVEIIETRPVSKYYYDERGFENPGDRHKLPGFVCDALPREGEWLDIGGAHFKVCRVTYEVRERYGIKQLTAMPTLEVEYCGPTRNDL